MSAVKLGELVTILGGGTPDRSKAEYWGGDIPWASVKDFKSTALSATQESITLDGLNSSATNLVPAGSVVVPTRMALGKAAVACMDLAINQDLKALQINDPEQLDRDFLLRFLLSKAAYIEGQGKGATVKGITLDVLRNLDVPLPSLTEQKRIAAILDKADSMRRKRQQAIRLADDFLRAAFLDMFGDPVTNPKGWQVVKLGELAKSDRYAIKAGPFGSALKKECYVSSGYRIYGQEQVIRDDLTFGDYYINEDKYRELESCKVESGDMLISLVGTFGKICIVPPEFEPGIINPRLMKMSFDPLKATPCFMKALLTSDSMVRKIQSLSHGGTMGIVNVGIMKDLDIAVPPVAIQIRFEEVQQKLTTLKANYDAAEEQTTSAFSALQSQFFS